MLALVPHIAAWGETVIDGALGAAGTFAAAIGFDELGNTGIFYSGLETLGGGATLAGIILGAVTVSSSSASSRRPRRLRSQAQF